MSEAVFLLQDQRDALRRSAHNDDIKMPDEKRDKLEIPLLTDGFRLEGVGRAAFTFTLAVDGGQLHLVAGLWLQASDGHLIDGACSMASL